MPFDLPLLLDGAFIWSLESTSLVHNNEVVFVLSIFLSLRVSVAMTVYFNIPSEIKPKYLKTFHYESKVAKGFYCLAAKAGCNLK